MADRKWGHVLGTVLPAAQRHVARLLGLSEPRQVAFAPNTHEFVAAALFLPRLVAPGARARERARVPQLPPADPAPRGNGPAPAHRDSRRTLRDVRGALRGRRVLAGLGPRLALARVLRFGVRRPRTSSASCAPRRPARSSRSTATTPSTPSPSTSRAIHARAFYLAGGYKYAMSGEGACFLAIPPGCDLRPADTGLVRGLRRRCRARRATRCPIRRMRSGSGARPSIPRACTGSMPSWTGSRAWASRSATSTPTRSASSRGSWRGWKRSRFRACRWRASCRPRASRGATSSPSTSTARKTVHQRLLAAGDLHRPPRPAPAFRIRRLPRRRERRCASRDDGEGAAIESPS